jgi:hypothetical protein
LASKKQHPIGTLRELGVYNEAHLVWDARDSEPSMQVIPLDEFPSSLSDLRRFHTMQLLWEQSPAVRPDLALEMKGLCRSINQVVTTEPPAVPSPTRGPFYILG